MRTKKKLLVTTQGVKGGKKHTNILGSICCNLTSDLSAEKQAIYIDNYKGYADTYQQRDEPLINIDSDTLSWSGSFADLVNIIAFVRSCKWLCQADAPADYKAEVERIMNEANKILTSNK